MSRKRRTAAPERQAVTYTVSQVMDLAEQAAALIVDELGLGERDSDLYSLIEDALLYRLTEPGEPTLDQVITRYRMDIPEEVRSWWNGWT
jgi:hypothetical protein